jgi:threonine aldolase
MNDVWLRNADHANKAARSLADRIQHQAGMQPLLPIESNAIYFRWSEAFANSLSAAGWNFYKMIEPDVYRLMCSWATTDEQIDALVRQVSAIASQSKP